MISLDEIIDFVADKLGCDSSTLDINSEFGHHFAWDSLAHVELMTEVESRYNVKIDENNIAELNTIGRILDYINSTRS